MKRAILIVVFTLLAASLAVAEQLPLISRVYLQNGKSFEGGIAINPVTHKVYLIAELATEGADDEKVVFVVDEDVLRGAKSARKISIPTSVTAKYIPIANENEYIVVDSTRNLIYVATKYGLQEAESDTEGDSSGEGESETTGGDGEDSSGGGGVGTLINGTLTVIDGNTDTVIATYPFQPGIEPEGVAVDTVNSVVYVAAKAPEGEAASDNFCAAGTPIYDVGEPGDVECWTPGMIYAFYVDRDATPIVTYLKAIRAGDDPESIVFENGYIYAANEDDGTVTVASAVLPDKTGGDLLTDSPVPPSQPYSLGIAPYRLGAFYDFGPNPLACAENKFEADKMASGGGAVYLTDDRSRIVKIMGTSVLGKWEIPGATACEAIPNSDGGGLNTANNIAFMPKDDGIGLLYVVSEQNTVAVIKPNTMEIKGIVTVPGAVHLDGIAVDKSANRVWLTDETLQAFFVLQGACANGVGVCVK